MAIKSLIGYFPSFTPGKQLIDGSDLQQLINQLFSVTVGIVAKAGGGQPLATQLVSAYNSVDTCASDNDSVMLPVALPGDFAVIYNNTAHTLTVFGQPTNPNTGVGDTIAASTSNTQQATATGVTQATALTAQYNCFAPGKWKQFLSG